MIPSFGIKREQKTTKKETRRQRGGTAGLGEVVHGLGDIPRDSHQELRAPIHLPSELRSSQLFYRNSSYNCSTGTALMTVLQDQQLNSS